MKVEAFHAALRSLPLAAPETVTRGRPFLILAPHPDDESLGLGGLIAAAVAAGTAVRVVVVSDGGGSHPGSRRVPRDRLVALREQEVRRAVRALGLAPEYLTCLGLPDTQVPQDGPAFEEAVTRIVAVADAAEARAVFTAWEGDPHCDHVAVALMARALRQRRPGLALWSYPIWGWHRDPGEEVDAPPPHGVRIDVAAWLAVKRRAIAAHASQMTDLIDDDPTGFRFTERTLAPFLQPVETVFEVPR